MPAHNLYAKAIDAIMAAQKENDLIFDVQPVLEPSAFDLDDVYVGVPEVRATHDRMVAAGAEAMLFHVNSGDAHLGSIRVIFKQGEGCILDVVYSYG